MNGFPLSMQSDNSSKNINLTILGLLLAIVELIVWLLDEWTGLFVSVLLTLLSASILCISYFVEWLEKSLTPKWYYQVMLVVCLTSLLLTFIYSVINGFHFNWQINHH